MSRREEDERWMDLALGEAREAEARGEVPIGCVIVSGGEVIGRGHNLREHDQDPTAHAEMIAIREAARRLGSFRVTPAVLYVTCEPCPMCAGALVNARIDRLVFGCHDPKAGACGTLYNIPADPRLNHRVEIVAGVREQECAEALSRFFRSLREKNKA